MAKVSKAKLKIAMAMATDLQDAYHRFRGDDETVWDDIPEERKMKMVETAELLLKDPTPENAHKLWMEDRLKTGWKFGEKLDVDSRTSPYLVDYDELEDDVKWKDWMWVNVITSYIERT